MPIRVLLAGLVMALASAPVAAGAFEMSFDWGAIPRCTSGHPNMVGSPVFRLSGVPAATKTVTFSLHDLNVPSFKHGGGTVAYGGATVPAGSFQYLSPCPPDGAHTYSWTATALGANGKALGTATAKQRYPG